MRPKSWTQPAFDEFMNFDGKNIKIRKKDKDTRLFMREWNSDMANNIPTYMCK